MVKIWFATVYDITFYVSVCPFLSFTVSINYYSLSFHFLILAMANGELRVFTILLVSLNNFYCNWNND